MAIDLTDAGAASGKRRRNLAATKADLLDAALGAFAERGYDNVSAREIAAAVGVNPMLVSRYFGNKEQLFAAAVDAAFSSDAGFGELLRGGRTTLGKRLARYIVAKRSAAACGPDALSLLLRSAPNAQAAAVLRSAIARHFEHGLAAILPEGHAGERAALLLALIAGFQTMGSLIRMNSLADADEAVLVDLLAKMFNAALRRAE